MKPEDIIGPDAVQALTNAGYEIIKAPPVEDRLFEALWASYPNKVAKQAAKRAYRAARRKGLTHDFLVYELSRYVGTKPLDRPWLHLATFLNDQRWTDTPAPVYKSAGERTRANLTREIESEQASAGSKGVGSDSLGGLSLFDRDRI